MRSIALFLVASSALALSALPSRAEFLLNCRLMDRRDSLYEHYCLGDQDSFLVGKCFEQAFCDVKKQNFKGAYYSEKNQSELAVGSETGLSAVDSALSAAVSVRGLANSSDRSSAGQ